MHEYSIVSSLLRRVEEEAARHRATEVHRVRVRLGEASGVEPTLLRTAFELARQGTCCAGASLEIVAVPVRWGCRGCGCDIATGGALRCPACGGPARLVSGDEILLERLELEVEDV